MSPTEIIERVTEEGVLLAISPSGNVAAKGDPQVIDRWLAAIKQNKAAIIAELQLELRRAKVQYLMGKGIVAADASKLNDILSERDDTLDERRACAECSSWLGGRCRSGHRPIGDADIFTLHRCQWFYTDQKSLSDSHDVTLRF